jgi:phasin family protein
MENTFESFLAPVKELNDLALKSIEQIAAIQVKAIQENTKISVDALKSASEIKDIDTLKDYLQNQASVAQNLSNSAVKDAQEIAKLGESYVSSVQQVVEKSVPAA